MRKIDPRSSMLLVIDFQSRLMPAIEAAEAAVANARRLIEAAKLLDIPILFTEQNPGGIGHTVPDLLFDGAEVLHKMTFDGTCAPAIVERLPQDKAFVVAGCEAHVCVLQTVLGLLDLDRRVFLVRDALGARRAESKETAIRRLERHGAEIVTTEMVLFEWLETSEHPRFREALALVK